MAAVRAGHDVTAVSRSGNVPDGVTAVVGSATDAEVARAAVTRSIVAAMRESGVRRLVVQSSLGAGDSGKQLPLPLRQLSTKFARALAATRSRLLSVGLLALTRKPCAQGLLICWKAPH